ncbi:TadE family type IV pilus minor pilin [Amycolatopsis alkalitolerans]|uniref:Pilus assembly protein n=1 Tax=Amycolatopsis alkalitolerans TaxID=2547244 RepID=A0A5C4LSS6_9PSEU|nr:TadE family type IV pilus minor pilin [Amycolatopsis alkalitolerans]TNC21064.1 pilus assembly protein [Amycolatopsis alkalitolerans]
MSPPARAEPDRGAVTVEAAIALGALTLVFGLVLAGVVAVAGQIRCTDAAREAARLVARGDRPLAARAVAEIMSGARLRVEVTGDAVTVDVTAEPLGGLLPGLHLHGHAYALLEPGVPDAPG